MSNFDLFFTSSVVFLSVSVNQSLLVSYVRALTERVIMSHDHDYSTLEVVPHTISSTAKSPVLHYQEKQATPDYENRLTSGNDIETYFPEGLETVPAPKGAGIPPETPYDIQEVAEVSKRRRRNLWLIGGTVLLVVVIAAVVGGVVGSRKSTPSSDASTSTPSASAVSSTTSSSTASPTPSLVHNIAAIGWNTSKTDFSRRIYFLDESSQLTEGAQDPQHPQNWMYGGLGVYAKPGSPIAAAITNPGFDLVSTLPTIIKDSRNQTDKAGTCSKSQFSTSTSPPHSSNYCIQVTRGGKSRSLRAITSHQHLL